MNPQQKTYRGNKSTLASKVCARCGRPMTYRKKWAQNWDQVRYCSERCRRTPGSA